MPAKLRVLIVDDSEDDTGLLLQELRRGRWEVTHQRVESANAMSAALEKHAWDVVIADYAMPLFSGPAALAVAIGRSSDIPFIFVSCVPSEEAAVQAMKAGAADYLSKTKLSRLVSAVEQALHTSAARREKRRIEQQLRERKAHLADAMRLARIGTWYLNLKNNTA